MNFAIEIRKLHPLWTIALLMTLHFILQKNVVAQTMVEVPKIKVAYSMAINISETRSIEIAKAVAETLEKELLVLAEAGEYIQNLLPATAKNPSCLSQKDCLLNAARTVHSDKLILLVIIGIADEIKIETTVVTHAENNVERRAAVLIQANQSTAKEQLQGKSHAFLINTPRRFVEPNKKPLAQKPKMADKINEPSPAQKLSKGRHLNRKTWLALGAAGVTTIAWAGWGLANNAGKDSDSDKNKTADLIFGSTTLVFLGAASIFYLTSGEKQSNESNRHNAFFHVGKNHGVFGYGGVF